MQFSTLEAKRLLQLASPVFLAQITLVLMTVVDTMMAGQVSPDDLAALSIATGIWNPLMFSLQGILLALTGIVAHAHGAGEKSSITHFFQQSLYLAIILFGLGLFIASFTPSILAMLDTSEKIETLSQDYIDYIKWGMMPYMVFTIYRNVTEGLGSTKPAFYISLFGLVINIIANYTFIYGKFGAPALGSAGCGLATAIVLFVMAIAQIIYGYRSALLSKYKLLTEFQAPKLQDLMYIAKLGLPICLATFFEITLFACVPLFIADLGAIAVSGHQIAANITTILYMMPLSLSIAIAIRVGNVNGLGDKALLNKVVFTSFCIALLVAAFVAAITFACRNVIPWFYTNDPEVVALASSIIVLACLYQLPDALQVSAGGILRGLKYTKPIAGVTFFSYWLVGFALGYVLAKKDWITDPMGPVGFWIGIIVGITVAAVLLIYSVRNRLVKENAAV